MAGKRENDEEDMGSADDKAVAAMHRRAADREAGESEPTEVDVDEEEDDEPEERPAARDSSSRSDRRRNRFKEAQEGRARAEADAAEARSRADAAEARYQASIAQQQRPAQEAAAPKSQARLEADQAIRDVYQLHDDWENMPAEQKTQEKLREFRQKYQELEERKQVAVQRANQPTAPQQMSPVAVYLHAQHADLMSHPRGTQMIGAHWQRMIGMGKPDSMETLNLVVQEARRDLNLIKRETVTRREPGLAAKLTAPNNGGGSGGGSSTPKRVIRMGGGDDLAKARRQMAQEMYPKLSSEKAMEKWAKRIGKKGLERGDVDE